MYAEIEMSALRRQAWEVLEHGRRRDVVSRAVDRVLIGLVAGNVAGVVVQSIPGLSPGLEAGLQAFDRLCVLVFALEYAARLWVAPEHPLLARLGAQRARWRCATTPLMLIDALAFVPLLVEWLLPTHPLLRLLRLVRFLKLARYSPALATIGRVLAAERRSLLACVVIITGVLLAAAATMLAVEGHVQPERLGDMPKAMWWAAAMLAKIGGAEVTPHTAPGRIVAAVTVMLGIFCFALPVAIIGRGFYEEIRRRDFIVTFAMVARVPLFAHLDVAAVAELVAILKARTVPAGTVVIRKGDRGDAMYFIASGAVEVAAAEGPVRLAEGSFFGEMALLTRERRNASVTALKASDLLVLDADEFNRLIERNPEIGAAVREVAAARGAARRSDAGS